MITVTVYRETYECETAYKGVDSIRLMDASGIVTASFTGISDFSGFSIVGDNWSTPAEPDNSPIMVAMEDGSISKGSSTCNDISSALTTATAAETVCQCSMPKSGGDFTGAVTAAESSDCTLAQLRNIIVVDAGTDITTLAVRAGTIVMVRNSTRAT